MTWTSIKRWKINHLFEGQDPALSGKSNKTCVSCEFWPKKKPKGKATWSSSCFRFPSGKSGIFFVGEKKNYSIPLQCTELPSVGGKVGWRWKKIIHIILVAKLHCWPVTTFWPFLGWIDWGIGNVPQAPSSLRRHQSYRTLRQKDLSRTHCGASGVLDIGIGFLQEQAVRTGA